MLTQSLSPLADYPVKESIRDLARLQRTYDPSDEVFWTYFNARVLQNEPIGVEDFVSQTYTTPEPYGQLSGASID
ncbi:hypothetical protein FAES_2963 [Fibrella aestuarina BUZ 2]|uniref:Uncharacterized protein n=1 Tax=Fibrella aestuarina BUZ 2 TaxID=1166018 RepID=I0KA19_9BACT|nr:hypothetical protein [Fibrella aestuarina]CCH00972.1 hypothetical protein FAES_2963 [Fibrella aestuarina BUZ 2]